MNILNHYNFRLIDVFISGPLQIFISSYISRTHKSLFLLHYFMLFTGILNILYNGHNFLLFNSNIKTPLPLIKPFINLKYGKHQLHRLYNLIIMYPVFIFVLLHIDIPIHIKVLFLINIIIGIIYNLYYFIIYR